MKINDYIDSLRAKETEEEQKKKRESIERNMARQKFEEILPNIRIKVEKTLREIESSNRNLFTFEDTTDDYPFPEDNFPTVDNFKYPNDEKNSFSFLIKFHTKTVKTCSLTITTFRDNESIYVDTELYQASNEITVDTKISLEKFLEDDFEDTLVYLLQKIDEEIK